MSQLLEYIVAVSSTNQQSRRMIIYKMDAIIWKNIFSNFWSGE